jgi:hypothetical protein
MVGFSAISAYADAMLNGQTSFCSFRKVPSQASTAGMWVDLSMTAGNPLPNYYASSPLVAATLDGMRGIFHGGDKAPSNMYLAEVGLVTPTAGLVGAYKMLDYVLYYPFVDMDSTDEQTMDNTVTLPRFADGAGVLAMMVAAAPTTGGGSFTFNYINQDGVEKTSPTIVCNTSATSIASIITSRPSATNAGYGPFLRLSDGDTGIRSIVSTTMIVPNGGLATIVLVKPVADFAIREINTYAEATFVDRRPGPPRIYDGAYLNFIMNCAATVAAGQLSGHARFVWN